MAPQFTNDIIRIANKVKAPFSKKSLFTNCVIKTKKLSVFSYIQKLYGFQKLNASSQIIYYLTLIWKLLI
jgi:hypothetical protein